MIGAIGSAASPFQPQPASAGQASGQHSPRGQQAPPPSGPGAAAPGAGDSPAVIAAKQALGTAQAAVDADRRHHSPSCVAVDQKQVDAAQQALAAADAASAHRLSLVA